MSTSTQHFGLVLPTTSDKWNPLLYENPAIEQIDTQMFVNQNHAIQTATHVRSGGINQIVRDVQTSMFFTFVATDDYFVGDTFTLDGNVVPARLADGSTLVANTFRINSNVLCAYENGILTIFSNSAVVDTSAIDERLDNIETEIGNTDYSDYGNTLSQAIDNVGVKADTAVTGVQSVTTKLGGMEFRYNPEDGNPQVKVDDEWVNFKSGEGATLLWTNPSPTASFSPQNINQNSSGWVSGLSIEDYDYILIETAYSTSYLGEKSLCLFMKPFTGLNGTFTLNTQISSNQIAVRLINGITNSGINFDSGSVPGISNNTYGVPLKIWGCKSTGDVPPVTAYDIVAQYGLVFGGGTAGFYGQDCINNTTVFSGDAGPTLDTEYVKITSTITRGYNNSPITIEAKKAVHVIGHGYDIDMDLSVGQSVTIYNINAVSRWLYVYKK